MSNTTPYLRQYFEALRSATPISFDRSKDIVLAASLLRNRNVASLSFRIGLSLLFKRYCDALLMPLVSAGLSLLVLVFSGRTLAVDDGIHAHYSMSFYDSITSLSNHHSPAAQNVKMRTQEQTSNLNPEKGVRSDAYNYVLASVNPVAPVGTVGYNILTVNAPPPPPSNAYQGLIDFGIRTIGAGLYSSDPSQPMTRSLVQNAALNISYRLNERMAVGLEVGQECLSHDVSYAMHMLSGDPSTGRTVLLNTTRVENDNSLVSWYGLFSRYLATDFALGNSMTPFGQVTLGYSSAGPLGKVMAGLQWSPAASVDLMAGTEMTYLNYSVEGARRSSLKAALTLGVTGKW